MELPLWIAQIISPVCTVFFFSLSRNKITSNDKKCSSFPPIFTLNVKIFKIHNLHDSYRRMHWNVTIHNICIYVISFNHVWNEIIFLNTTYWKILNFFSNPIYLFIIPVVLFLEIIPVVCYIIIRGKFCPTHQKKQKQTLKKHWIKRVVLMNSLLIK